MEEEIKHLRRENEILRQEREILKKLGPHCSLGKLLLQNI